MPTICVLGEEGLCHVSAAMMVEIYIANQSMFEKGDRIDFDRGRRKKVWVRTGPYPLMFD